MKLHACCLVLTLVLWLGIADVRAAVRSKTPMKLVTNSKENKISFAEEGEGRIVGGQNAVLGQFPYMVVVEREITDEFGTYSSSCGGSLIGLEWVLTAAHCVVTGASNYTLLMGLVTKPCVGPCIQTVPINVIIHEYFNKPVVSNNDFALFQMRPGVVTLGANVAIVQLPAISDACLTYYDYNTTVSGWGSVSSDPVIDNNAPFQLRYVDVRVLPSDSCLPFWGPKQFTEKHLCISTDRNKQSYAGDSGGPLVIENNGTFTQIGVVSYGGTFGDGNAGVYGRVSSYLDWIHEKTGLVIRP